MIAKTKVSVSYNNGVKGTKDGIVTGIIDNTSWLNDFTTVGANYTYLDDEGNAIWKDSFVIEGAEIQTLYDAVKGSIPSGLDYADTERITYYLAMVIQMAQTFGIPTTDIEIIA